MKRLLWPALALALATLPARGDVVTLNDGTVLRGIATEQGEWLVVRLELGETRLRRSAVAGVEVDAQARREAAEKEEEKQAVRALVPPDQALVWETDADAATRLATASNKLILTFSVVGELGTGHC